MKKIISPIYIYLPRARTKDKKLSLNLNVFRNMHFQAKNQSKLIYRDLMYAQLRGKTFKTPIILSFYLYPPDKRIRDRANVLSIVEKFFCDALTYYRCIPDDGDQFVQSTHYYGGLIDKSNPRAEILIEENYDG